MTELSCLSSLPPPSLCNMIWTVLHRELEGSPVRLDLLLRYFLQNVRTRTYYGSAEGEILQVTGHRAILCGLAIKLPANQLVIFAVVVGRHLLSSSVTPPLTPHLRWWLCQDICLLRVTFGCSGWRTWGRRLQYIDQSTISEKEQNTPDQSE